MHSCARHGTWVYVLALCVAVSSAFSPAAAGYVISIDRVDGGGELLPGQSFTLAVRLDSSTGFDQHNSAIFWLVFSEAGLWISNYDWSLPYETGGVLDQSTGSDTPLPLAINADTYERPGDEAGLIDLEFSNVLLSGRFGSGILLTAEFMVPGNYSGTGLISIAAEVDTIADGFDVLDVAVDAGVNVIVIPAPFMGAIGIAVLGVIAPQRRRRG